MEWIRVKDRLPPRNRPVLTWNGEKILTAEVLHIKKGEIQWIIATFVFEGVTHWKNLPKPPKD